MWESLSFLMLRESFDENNLEMGTDSVVRQMHSKKVQHYWANIVKQQITGAGGFHTERHFNSANGGSLESNHVSDKGAGTVRQSNWRPYNAAKRRIEGYHQQKPSSGA